MWNDDYYDLCANEEFGFRQSPVGMQQGLGSSTPSAAAVSRNNVICTMREDIVDFVQKGHNSNFIE